MVVTGTRAEFGLLKPVMDAIAAKPNLSLITAVTGLHLTCSSWRDIVNNGFSIDARVRMQRCNETGRESDVAALARGVSGFGRLIGRIKPDVVLVLGDRIEVLAASSAASVMGVHIAHIHGGDRAEGVADESIRHAVSKMAHIHFPATAESKKRLVKIGEQPNHIYQVGSPAIDGLKAIKPHPDPPFCVIAQHPIGKSDSCERKWMTETLAAVQELIKSVSGGPWILLIGPNNDPGSDGIRGALRMKAGKGHLARDKFLPLLAGARLVVGNSSAGLIEAAALKTACVNIGPRQAGREKPDNVIDCDYGKANALKAMKKALKLDLRKLRHPYGSGKSGERIAEVLAGIELEGISVRKRNSF